LDNAIYFWDQANNRYASYVAGVGVNGGTRYIPCMQGFYVRVTNPGTGTLGMTNSARSSVVNRDNWREASQSDPMIRLKADNGSTADETLIRFNDQATDHFDSQLDAYKLPSSGTTASISTKTANVDYTVNSLPISILQKTIPVKLIAGLSGAHMITADITNFESTDSVVLLDKLLGVKQDLMANPTYACSLIKGDTTSRFFINYKKAAKTTAVDGLEKTAPISIYGQEQIITVVFNKDNSKKADIVIYDVLGTLIYKVENKDVSSGKVIITLPQVRSGIYIVKAQTGNTSKTQEVLLSK
jgi:hypothetical protein